MIIGDVRKIAHQAGVPETAVRGALDRLVLVWSREATPEQLQELDGWRSADPNHERAWRWMQRLDERLAPVPGSLAANSLRAADRAGGRRRFLKSVGVLLVGGGATYSLSKTSMMDRLQADHRTAVGEIRSLTLADGTRITLNTASAVNVRYGATERRLIMVTGEILVATAADPRATEGRAARPFIVETADGVVRPIGTRFTVRRTGAETEVSVLEGAVRAVPVKAAKASLRLEAGQRARVTASSVDRLPALPGAAAWADGLLVAEQMPLGDLLKELARYRTGIVRCAPDAATLRVSGTFPITDTDRALAALSAALPIRVSSLSRYWVTVEAR